MWRIIVLLLLSINSFSQKLVIDTLKNAVAGVNSFNAIPVYGTTSGGGVYGAGLNILFSDDGKPLPLQFVRIDFDRKKATYKNLPGVLSGNGAFWMSAFDSYGNAYLSINAPVRKVLRFNLKDSIQFNDLGNPFRDGISWAYAMSIGRDGKMYFGGSEATYWSSYDPKTHTFEKHPAIDTDNDFVLSIAGDNDYVYAQTGQRNSVQLWSIRKKDDSKKLLAKISNTTRIEIDVHEDGVYASFRSDTLSGIFKLVNGDTVRIIKKPATKKVMYSEVNSVDQKKVSSVFDPIKNNVFFSKDDQLYDSIHLPASINSVAIKRIFSFPNDTANIYFTGDYYGNFYRYNLKTGTSYLLGSTGYNLYATLPLNDSIMFLGGYPNGFLMKWNRNMPWTTRKFLNGKLVMATDSNANPRVIGFWKNGSKPAAGFHHTAQLLFDANKNVVGAGNVIRIGNGASIGVYDMVRDSMYGVAYDPYSGMGFSSLGKWKKTILYAMNNLFGRQPKLYFYNSVTNKMTDSINLGYDDYGQILVKGDILYGIANDKAYKINLAKKKVIAAYRFPKKSIAYAQFLSGNIAIVDTKNIIPPSFFPTVSLPGYRYYLEINRIVYAIRGNNIVRIRGLSNK